MFYFFEIREALVHNIVHSQPRVDVGESEPKISGEG